MLQKLSAVIPCDSSGVYLTKIFSIYQRPVAKVGTFAKISVKLAKPKAKLRKKKKSKIFIVRTVYQMILADTSCYSYLRNNALTIKKRIQVRGRAIFGPTTYTVKRKKFLKSFVRVL